MNKTAIIVILLVLLGLALYYLYGRDRDVSVEVEEPTTEEPTEPDSEGEENEESEEDRGAEVRGMLEEASINLPDIDASVELSGGEASFDAGAGADGYIVLGDAFAFTRQGSTEFALVHATMSTGGSGTFDYLFAFEVSEGSLTHTGSAYLGDRIIVEEIEAEGGTDVSVDILERHDDEPLSALPTVPETLEFTLSADGELTE